MQTHFVGNLNRNAVKENERMCMDVGAKTHTQITLACEIYRKLLGLPRNNMTSFCYQKYIDYTLLLLRAKPSVSFTKW